MVNWFRIVFQTITYVYLNYYNLDVIGKSVVVVDLFGPVQVHEFTLFDAPPIRSKFDNKSTFLYLFTDAVQEQFCEHLR